MHQAKPTGTVEKLQQLRAFYVENRWQRRVLGNAKDGFCMLGAIGTCFRRSASCAGQEPELMRALCETTEFDNLCQAEQKVAYRDWDSSGGRIALYNNSRRSKAEIFDWIDRTIANEMSLVSVAG